MLISGTLGFDSIFLAVIAIFGLVIRHRWVKAKERSEEIRRLVVAASEEAEMAELEAAAEYSSMPVVKHYQCAVCFSPTTTRCSQCKAVRYCSGKCQIIHWRQGHKDECQLPIKTVDSNERSHIREKASSVNQVEICGNDFQIKGKYNASSEARPVMHIEDKVQPCAEKKADICSASINTSSTCFSSSAARSASSVDASINGVLDSTRNTSDVEIDSSRSEHIVDSVNNTSFDSELSNVRFSSYVDETNHRNQSVLPDGDGPQITRFRSKRTISGAALSADSVSDASKQRGPQSSSYKRSFSLTNDRINGSQRFEGKELRSISFRGSSYHPSTITEHRSLLGNESAKSGSYHVLPSKSGSIPTLSSNAGRSLRISVQKVIQQFRASKLPKTDLLGIRRDTAGKHDYKSVFPCELFMHLYSCDALELNPFGLVNCGNR
ncbi:ubiquitinyl hydrolase 1 [Sarracenia purpurea var. burkii]